MDKKDKEVLARVANHAISDSRHSSQFPKLTKNSPREDVLEWLQLNDRNGVYTDEAVKAETEEGLEPLTSAEAWEALENMLSDDWDTYILEIEEKEKSQMAKEANKISRQSHRGDKAPTLGPDSSTDQIARWLQWADPEGHHTMYGNADHYDEVAEDTGYNHAEAWLALDHLLGVFEKSHPGDLP